MSFEVRASVDTKLGGSVYSILETVGGKTQVFSPVKVAPGELYSKFSYSDRTKSIVIDFSKDVVKHVGIVRTLDTATGFRFEGAMRCLDSVN